MDLSTTLHAEDRAQTNCSSDGLFAPGKAQQTHRMLLTALSWRVTEAKSWER